MPAPGGRVRGDGAGDERHGQLRGARGDDGGAAGDEAGGATEIASSSRSREALGVDEHVRGGDGAGDEGG